VTALTCASCGLRYGRARLPEHLLSAGGASCPRCGAPLSTEARAETAPTRRPRFGSTPERHREAVRRTLAWAEEAAAEGDYRTALSWLATIEAVDGELPAGLEARRRAWATHARAQVADPAPR
jgi:hypothetical protein